MKGILVILDGAADRACKELGGKTPLEAAITPNLDWLAGRSDLGYMYPVKEFFAPESDAAVLSILGQNPFDFSRGWLEAIGAGVELKRGDLALRTNFATIDNLKNKKILDRRAGRGLSTKEANILAKEINKLQLNKPFIFKPTIQHRGVLIFRGGFSDNITNTDPEYKAKGHIKHCFNFKFSEPLDEEDLSKFSSNLVNDFINESYKILEKHPLNIYKEQRKMLKANILLTRGAGIDSPKIRKMKGWASINYMPLEIGIAKTLGMDNYSFDYPDLKKDVYENLREGLRKAMKFALKTIKRKWRKYDYFYIHLKETDAPGHDGKAFEKKEMIEMIDKEFFSTIAGWRKRYDFKLAVTCDHPSVCSLKMHTSDPVPVLLYTNKMRFHRFTEKEARLGKLGRMHGKDFLGKIGFN